MLPGSRALVGMAIALAGCSDEADVTTEPPACAVPNRLVGERCIEPGIQDDGCPAGTLGLSDGSCGAAGFALLRSVPQEVRPARKLPSSCASVAASSSPIPCASSSAPTRTE